MQQSLDYIVERISTLNRIHGKKIKANIKKFDNEYFNRAGEFFNKYELLLKEQNRTVDYAIDCYLQMIADINYETVRFITTGEYSSKTFEEVNARVYNNPEIMEYYVHGILMSQFLWAHHYNILLFFNKVINENRSNISHYLEVGGGHGLYASEAIRLIGNIASYDIVDISESSLALAKKMINNNSVNFTLSDIFNYLPAHKFDFITMGEVIEHVEEPVKLLQKLFDLLTDDGKLFITAPTNGPTIDHIYLFKNAQDIRDVIRNSGFEIEKEFTIYAEDVTEDIAEKYKVSMMYAGLLIKPKDRI